MAETERIVLAITGASGATYGVRMLQVLDELGIETHLMVTNEARINIRQELDISVPEDQCAVSALLGKDSPHVVYHPLNNLAAPISSGSFAVRGMAVVPCSMGTLGRIAGGLSGNLVERAADVNLKERRPLVLVTRETPLQLIHLENMTRLARAGAVILPAAPGFYHRPKKVEDLVDFIVMRVLDRLGISSDLVERWKGLQKD